MDRFAILQNRRTTMTAVREEHAGERKVAAPSNPSTHSFAKNAADRFRFSFPDAHGRVISNDDERFRNKVVIVSITPARGVRTATTRRRF